MHLNLQFDLSWRKNSRQIYHGFELQCFNSLVYSYTVIRPWHWYVYLSGWWVFMVKLAGKYTIPMDAMGYYHNYINHTLHPGRLTWNMSSEVWFRSFSFLFMGDGCRFQSLIFQGVSPLVFTWCCYVHGTQTSLFTSLHRWWFGFCLTNQSFSSRKEPSGKHRNSDEGTIFLRQLGLLVYRLLPLSGTWLMGPDVPV